MPSKPALTTEQRREYNAAYYQRTKEQRAALYQAQRTERLAAQATYRATHRAEEAARARKWQKENPEKANALCANRRSRIYGSNTTHTAEEWLAILAASDGRCLRCGSTEEIQKDHIVPLARGGTNDASNLQPLCGPCNRAKGATTADYRTGGSGGD